VEKPAGHAFISYVREDSHDVDRLQHVLEEAGISVWRDTADLWPGEDWRAKIRRAITDDALVFIACFSSRSIARKRSYQNEELLLAIEQLRLRRPDDPWLIPVRFDDCDVPDLELGGGRTFASIQRADFFGDGRDVGVARLVSAVLRLLGRPSPDQDIGEKGVRVIKPPKPAVASGQNSKRLEFDLSRGRYRMSWTAEYRDSFSIYYGDNSLVDLPVRNPGALFIRSGEEIVYIDESGRHAFTVRAANATWQLAFKRDR